MAKYFTLFIEVVDDNGFILTSKRENSLGMIVTERMVSPNSHNLESKIKGILDDAYPARNGR